MSDNAFHEKAGRSQVDSFLFLLDRFFSYRVSHCRHASIRTLEERFVRSVQVGRSRFSRCCYLINDLSVQLRVNRGPGVRRSHRNSAMAFIFFLPGTVLILFCCLFRRRQRELGCCCATVRTLLRSPTSDAATPPAFSRSQRWLASCHFFLRARPASGPSA